MEALVHRDELEISPFVSTWHPMLAQLGPSVTVSTLAQSLGSAIKAGRQNGREVYDLAKKILEAVTGARLSESILSDMQTAVLESVQVKDDTDIEYLIPLVRVATQHSELSIATLNYDTVVENLCKRHNFPCSDGIDDSDRSHQARRVMAFHNEGIRLYKLHGSTSWKYHLGQKVVSHVEDGVPTYTGEHVVRFGGRNKLTAHWPFFELFWYWRESLKSAKVLWIIGYSFRDDHVNEAIINWLGSDDSRQIAIVDPYFEAPFNHPLRGYIGTVSTDFEGDLTSDPSTPTGYRTVPIPDEKVRIAILRAQAGPALLALEQSYPNLPLAFARESSRK
jgi:hypothetical protein